MKFSTRARYGLRMMVELARVLLSEELVHLGRIAKITGLSVNYLAQLAIPLKNSGLLIGVSGKNGGYRLGRPPENIRLSEIIEAVQGPVSVTDCASNPDVCLNASFCEARAIWVILSGSMMEILGKYTLSDLIDKRRMQELRNEYAHFTLLDPGRAMAGGYNGRAGGCPVKTDD